MSLFVGSANVPLADTAWAYFGAGDPRVVLVMRKLRLPRAALALQTGIVVLFPMALPLIWSARKGLDALSFGEETALSMGVNARGLRLQLILGTACLSGVAKAVAGMIGFVGLVIPRQLLPGAEALVPQPAGFTRNGPDTGM